MRSLYDVENILLSHSEPSIALAALRTRASLTSLLNFLRTDSTALDVVASRSYRHRNGFDKIVLAAPEESLLKLVLHVWPKDSLESSDNIHNHRWDFSSVVLCGALQLEFFDRSACGKRYSVMRYQPMSGMGNFQLCPRGAMTVSSHASVTMAMGSTYSWACNRLHRAWGLPGQVTATLIVQGPPTRASTTVLVCQDDAHRLDGPQRLYRLQSDEVSSTLAVLTKDHIQRAWSLDACQNPGYVP
jgi:hypothetical protein